MQQAHHSVYHYLGTMLYVGTPIDVAGGYVASRAIRRHPYATVRFSCLGVPEVIILP
jgi:hypothetical protein